MKSKEIHDQVRARCSRFSARKIGEAGGLSWSTVAKFKANPSRRVEAETIERIERGLIKLESES